jgi:hypothetical protein
MGGNWRFGCIGEIMATSKGISSFSASSGRITNPKPSITYNSFPGIFNITNVDLTANYSSHSSVTAGSLTFSLNPAPTPSTVTLSAADSIATVGNRTAKGVATSPTTLAERKSFTYTYVVTPPPATGTCYNYSPPGGTRYGTTWMAFYGSPYTYLNPAPGYIQAPSEWYKIT